MIILGIDPGLRYAGYGIAKKEQTKTFLLDYGCLNLPQKEPIPVRLKLLYDFFLVKIIEYKVTDLALETPFLGKNPQNFMKLGYVRGALYLLAIEHNLVLHEFAPREIKQAITGWGAAPKDQVARVILNLFPKMDAPKREDVTDALAVTLTGLWRSKQMILRK
ncbi:MAG: crossover junction endodeoxyribonuclease RuvC [Candidatus Babeliales bacterium]